MAASARGSKAGRLPAVSPGPAPSLPVQSILESISQASWGFDPYPLELSLGFRRQDGCTLEIRASFPALTFLLAQGNRERDCPVVHKVADRRMPIQRNRDQIQPPIVPCRPKLAEGLRNAQSALCDELFQGRARHILFGRLAATTMDSSLVIGTGIGINEQDHILVLRRGNELRCKGIPPEPNLFLTCIRNRSMCRDKRSPPTKEGNRYCETSGMLLPRLSSSQTSTPLLPTSAAVVQTSHPSHLNCADLLTLVSWSPSTWYPSCGTAR